MTVIVLVMTTTMMIRSTHTHTHTHRCRPSERLLSRPLRETPDSVGAPGVTAPLWERENVQRTVKYFKGSRTPRNLRLLPLAGVCLPACLLGLLFRWGNLHSRPFANSAVWSPSTSFDSITSWSETDCVLCAPIDSSVIVYRPCVYPRFHNG